ncbi:MAG TPA: hypothetical protein VHX61_10860 [Rhizomicrobium sp.]|nr:hypothetical protein [Rhizomicrobium sp.]
MLLTSAAAVALLIGGSAQAAAPGASALGARGNGQAAVHHAPPKGSQVLYDQNSGTGSDGFFSQTLSSYPQYDEYLADDFPVPKGQTWKVSEVDVGGFYYVESGPASSVNVYFWKNKKDLPNGKKALVSCLNVTPTAGLDTGAFQITLPKKCAKKASFAGGKKGTTYWVSVQANMTGELTSGYWAWDIVSVHNNQAAGDWYGGSVETLEPSCNTSFQTMDYCTGTTTDLSFELMGTSKK